eukprot:gb/GECG01005803.1/.p1 GENE.gb/GECG01005803.1/~~gb/GECG01005803.1/.p1  ORF type:complete len:143 (+),score=21.03 gb/GECG01005803.1/:1-429(+)
MEQNQNTNAAAAGGHADHANQHTGGDVRSDTPSSASSSGSVELGLPGASGIVTISAATGEVKQSTGDLHGPIGESVARHVLELLRDASIVLQHTSKEPYQRVTICLDGSYYVIIQAEGKIIVVRKPFHDTPSGEGHTSSKKD